MKLRNLILGFIIAIPIGNSYGKGEELLEILAEKTEGIRFYKAKVDLIYHLEQGVAYQDIIECGGDKVFVQRMLYTAEDTRLQVASILEDGKTLKIFAMGEMRIIDKEKVQGLLGREIFLLNWLKPFAYNGILADLSEVLDFKVEEGDTFLYVFDFKASFLDIQTLKNYKGRAKYFFNSEDGVLKKIEFYDEGGRLLLEIELTDFAVLPKEQEIFETLKYPTGVKIEDLTDTFLELLK